MSLKSPWFLIASTAAAALGLAGLFWYDCLSSQDKARADELTAEYARRLYGRAVAELTDGQHACIHKLVQADLGNQGGR
jgi:hypothetical protein